MTVYLGMADTLTEGKTSMRQPMQILKARFAWKEDETF